MSMIIGFVFLLGAIALFFYCVPQAVKECDLQQVVRLKRLKAAPVPKSIR